MGLEMHEMRMIIHTVCAELLQPLPSPDQSQWLHDGPRVRSGDVGPRPGTVVWASDGQHDLEDRIARILLRCSVFITTVVLLIICSFPFSTIKR